MQDWEQKLLEASKLISVREGYQRLLGKLAHDISQQYGNESLEGFAHELKESYGLTISKSTLRNYSWVYEKTSSLGLPEDISYRTLQYIASSGDPEGWAVRIKKEGLSSAEVYKLIRQAKGLDNKETKTIPCPSCGASVEIT